MDYKCTCGETTTLKSHEELAVEFKCPKCGTISRLDQSGNPNPHPKPWIAALLAVLSPGLGHFYSGNIKIGVTLIGIGPVLVFVSLLLSFHWDAPPFNMVVPLLAGLAYFIFSIFSAVKVAKTYHTLVEKPKRITSFLFYPVIVVGVALSSLLIASIFDNFETYNIRSTSMANTIMIGDKVICDESAFDDDDPQRDDLVVFFSPSDKTTKYIQRCVAIGGDIIQMDKKDLYINGREAALPPTAIHGDPEFIPERDEFGPYQVPAGYYFLLGDNRDDSFDSRFFGPVDRRLIIGKAVRVWFNFKLGRIGVPLK